MIEKWKYIVGFSNYEISNLGNVRSWFTKGGKGSLSTTPRLMKISINSFGYRVVHIWSDKNKQHHLRVGKLVLETFRPNGREICRHLNGIKTDDRLINLKWGTYKQNTEDSKRHGTFPIGSKVHNAVLDEEKVRYIRKCSETPRALGRKFSTSAIVIRNARFKKTWKHVK